VAAPWPEQQLVDIQSPVSLADQDERARSAYLQLVIDCGLAAGDVLAQDLALSGRQSAHEC
jgi:hypothetical protein